MSGIRLPTKKPAQYTRSVSKSPRKRPRFIRKWFLEAFTHPLKLAWLKTEKIYVYRNKLLRSSVRAGGVQSIQMCTAIYSGLRRTRLGCFSLEGICFCLFLANQYIDVYSSLSLLTGRNSAIYFRNTSLRLLECHFETKRPVGNKQLVSDDTE